MAVLFGGKGYGQVEPNRCSFLHDGNIESQCIATADIENGAIVEVKKAGPTTVTIDGTTLTTDVGSVTAATTLSGLIGLNYTAERIYDDKTGLRNFKVVKGEYPRVGILKKGDVFTTNYVTSTTYTKIGDVKTALTSGTALYLDVGATITSQTAPTGDIVLQIVEETTMPDGQPAVKVQVI